MTFWGCVSAHPWFATVWCVLAWWAVIDVAALWHNVRRNDAVARINEAKAREQRP